MLSSLLTPVLFQICDLATGEILGPEERGEVLVQAPYCMRGYLNNPEATAEILDEDGWLHTG